MLNPISIANHLKYPPLKPKKIPDRFIWQTEDSFCKDIHVFRMFTKGKKSSLVALMRCCKAGYEDPPSMIVTFLMSYDRGKGYGSEMLKFAEKLSRNIGCEGRLMLRASTSLLPQKIPHIFYRKYGFTTNDSKEDKRLDMFIENQKDASYKDFSDMLMYYDPNKKVVKKKTIWEKIEKFIFG